MEPQQSEFDTKKNITTGYAKESDNKERDPQEQLENSGKTSKTQLNETPAVTVGTL